MMEAQIRDVAHVMGNISARDTDRRHRFRKLQPDIVYDKN
jgi:hypothetical protein